MPDSNELTFTTKIITTGVESGMAKTTNVVQAGSEKIASAMTAAKIATQQLGEAQAQVGASAAAGNQQALSIIQQYQQAAQQAQVAVAELTSAQQSQSAAAVENAAANNTAAAATERVGVSARQSAAASIGFLEGRTLSANRAAATFLVSTLGLQSAFQAGFAVVGLLAVGEVAVDVGGKLGDVAFKATEVGQILGGGMWDGIVALVQGVGWNIDELTKSEDQLIQKTAALQGQIASFTADSIKRTQGPKISSEFLAGFDLKKDEQVQAKIRQTVKELKDLESQAKETVEVYSAATGGLSAQPTSSALEAKVQIPEKQSELTYLQTQDEELQRKRQDTLLKGSDEQQHLDEERQRKAEEAARRAAAAQRAIQEGIVQDWKQQLGELNAVQNQTALQEATFWTGRAAIAQVGSKSYEVAVSEANRAFAKAGRESVTAQRQATTELSEVWIQTENSGREASKQQGELAASIAVGSERIAQAQSQAAISVAQAQLAYDQATGKTTALGAAQQTAALHAQEYTQRLKDLDAELSKIAADENLSPKESADKVSTIQAQIVTTQGQQKATGIQDQASIVQQTTQPWIDGANKIAGAWTGAFDKIFVGGRGSWDAVEKAGEQTVLGLINGAERLTLNWIEMSLKRVVTHQASTQAIVASDAAGAAQTKTISETTAITQIGHEAAVVFAKVYSALADIPIVGPVLAPVAAAGAYAGVVAMAAFDTGTSYVPKTGMAIIHEGESILPPPQASLMREWMRGGGNGGSQNGGGNSFTVHNNFQSGGTPADARKMQRDLHSLLRRQGLVQ